MTISTYIGRFAPSPTGPLHLGSLYTALASFLDAKANNGQWLVRIEDLDPPREQAGATASILKTLSAHGLHWHGDISYQSQRQALYEKTCQQLLQNQQAFYCNCSRQQLKPFHGFYAGCCHSKHFENICNVALRFKSRNKAISFHDNILGPQHSETIPTSLFNDFIIKRRDGLYAYMLAVVIDDIDQGINHIIRGSDILDSTFKQLELYQTLQHTAPSYTHLPVISAANGQKLSKQNLAPAINNACAYKNLLSCLQLLQQTLPGDHFDENVAQLLNHAIKHWDKSKIPATLSIGQINTSLSTFAGKPNL
ncbi:MAG: tRNA glutamyl-Q(34) synthetase GluQRS [Pseudomonadales bacterium]|nr:tRNA glutamyl-Q(34) synthetase GluQRS [Pseudomonadales bacterium]